MNEVIAGVRRDDRGRLGGSVQVRPLGALGAHVDSGRLSEAVRHGELWEIVCAAMLGTAAGLGHRPWFA